MPHASKIVAGLGMAAMAATVVIGLSLDAGGTQLGVPHPPFIGAYGPQANLLELVTIPAFVTAVALVPGLLRLTPARLRRGAVRDHADPARHAQHRARGDEPARPRAVRRPQGRGQERVPAVAGRVRLRAAVRAWTASRSWCRPARAQRRPSARAAAGHALPGARHLAAADRLHPVRRRGERTADLRAGHAPIRGGRGQDRRPARRLRPRAAALRRHERRRGLPDARPARRDPAAGRTARGSAPSPSPSSRCSPGRCSRSPRGRRSSSSPATASSPRSSSA